MTTALLVATAAFLGVSIAIGFHVRGRVRTVDEYISYPARLGAIPIAASLVGTVVGGGVFFAVGTMAYDAGVAPLFVLVSYVVGFGALAFLARRIRGFAAPGQASDMYSILERRLGAAPASHAYVTFLAIMVLCVYFFSLSGQILVLGVFVRAFAPSLGLSVVAVSAVLVGALTLIYAVWGGLPKDILTDTFQTAILLLAVCVAVVALVISRPSLQVSNLPQNSLNGLGYGAAFPVAVVLFFSPSYLARFDMWQRIAASRTDRVFRQALALSLPVIAVSYGFFVYLGIYARANGPGSAIRDSAVLWSINSLFGPATRVLLIVALYAAVMSTADTLLNVSTVSLWRLVTRGRDRAGGHELNSIRKWAMGVGGFAVVLILLSPDVVDLMVGAFSSIAIFAPSVLYVMLSREPKGRWAVACSAPAYVLFWVMYLVFPTARLYSFIPCTVLAVLILGALWIVSRARRHPQSLQPPRSLTP